MLPSLFLPIFLSPSLPSLSSTLLLALRRVRPALEPPLCPLALPPPPMDTRLRAPGPIGIIEACRIRWGGASPGGESESPYEEELEPYGFRNHFTVRETVLETTQKHYTQWVMVFLISWVNPQWAQLLIMIVLIGGQNCMAIK